MHLETAMGQCDLSPVTCHNFEPFLSKNCSIWEQCPFLTFPYKIFLRLVHLIFDLVNGINNFFCLNAKSGTHDRRTLQHSDWIGPVSQFSENIFKKKMICQILKLTKPNTVMCGFQSGFLLIWLLVDSLCPSPDFFLGCGMITSGQRLCSRKCQNYVALY